MTATAAPVSSGVRARTSAAGPDDVRIGSMAGERAYLDWEITLDRLELDILRCERGLEKGVDVRLDQWEPPTAISPLPGALVERASEIQRRQEAVVSRMADELKVTLRQRAAAEAIARTSVRGNDPVYVDIAI